MKSFFPYPGSVVDLLLRCLQWDSVFPRLSCGCLIGCTCLTVGWCLTDVFVVLATAFAQSVRCAAKGCGVCYHALMLFNMLFALAMVSSTCIVLGI